HALRGRQDAPQMALRVLGHRFREVLEQDARETVDDAKRSAQVMRDGVAERLELAPGHLELERARRLLAPRLLAARGQLAQARAFGSDRVDQGDPHGAAAGTRLRLDDQLRRDRLAEPVEDRRGQASALFGIERLRKAGAGGALGRLAGEDPAGGIDRTELERIEARERRGRRIGPGESPFAHAGLEDRDREGDRRERAEVELRHGAGSVAPLADQAGVAEEATIDVVARPAALLDLDLAAVGQGATTVQLAEGLAT